MGWKYMDKAQRQHLVSQLTEMADENRQSDDPDLIAAAACLYTLAAALQSGDLVQSLRVYSMTWLEHERFAMKSHRN